MFCFPQQILLIQEDVHNKKWKESRGHQQTLEKQSKKNVLTVSKVLYVTLFIPLSFIDFII